VQPADPSPPSAAIVDNPLSVDAVLAAVAHPGAGGVVVFVGAVRDHDGPEGSEQSVLSLDYSAHPGALSELERVMAVVREAHPGVRLAAHHRTGHLQIGDLAVVVAAAAAHRDEAFIAARRLIDDLKAEVPIWKHQSFADGSEEWVGLP
jgi:molybdopterin synthase catalytic subunit